MSLAEGATAPETLRQMDRETTFETLEREAIASTDGVSSLINSDPTVKLSGL
ncbi:hypothetical protein ABIC60_000006 [Phyllobacterium ifriqiyense]